MKNGSYDTTKALLSSMNTSASQLHHTYAPTIKIINYEFMMNDLSTH